MTPKPPAVQPGGPLQVNYRRAVPLAQWLLTGAVLLWISALVLFPVLAIVYYTVQGGWAEFAGPLMDREALRSFGLTIGITIAAVAVNVLFGVVLAIVLSRQRFFGMNLLDGLVNLPLAISPVVAGFMFIVLFGPDGWIGRWFEAGGIKIVYAVPGMVLATIFVTLPFVAREVMPVLREVGLQQEEAARTLGASGWQAFWRVTLPSIRWGLVYGITLTMSRALGEFGAVLVVSGNIIGRTQTATLHIHQEFTDFHYQGAYAASLVLAAASFILLVSMELIRKRVQARMEPRDG